MNSLDPRGPLKFYDEDRDQNGLTERPNVTWRLWATDALTVFCRGILAGVFPGLGFSGYMVATTDSINVQTLTAAGAAGFAVGLLLKGVERLHLWQARPENEMPNPYRAQPFHEYPVPMVPMKDADRVKTAEETKPPTP